MSSKRSSRIAKEENEVRYEPIPNRVIYLPPAVMPWPDWNDGYINSDKWESKSKTPRSSPRSKKSEEKSIHVEKYYEDPEPGEIHPDIKEHLEKFVRPVEVLSTKKVSLYSAKTPNFDLKLPDKLKYSLFLNYICDSIKMIPSFNVKHVSMDNSFFHPTTNGIFWKPWHNIYAMCKAGKGQTHSPQVNKYGRYAVRLFYMGCWERVLVDDTIPVDDEDNVLLPYTDDSALWPFILIKALMKMMLFHEHHSNIQFSVVVALTGWIEEIMPRSQYIYNNFWRMCLAFLPKFSLDSKESERASPRKHVKSAKSNKSTEREFLNPTNLFMSYVITKVPEYPEFHYFQPLNMIRDTPLHAATPKDSTDRWKRIRWIYWAARKFGWLDELLIPPYRCALTIIYDESVAEVLKVEPEIENRLFDVETSPEFEPNVDTKNWITWIDLYKITILLNRVLGFYVPEKLTTRVHMSNMPNLVRFVKKGVIHPVPYCSRINPTKNEPRYMFLDLDRNSLVLFELSVLPDIAIGSDHAPTFLRPYHAALTVEHFKWVLRNRGTIVANVRTNGTATSALRLKPGRHIFKLWVDTDLHYMCRIYSDTEFTIDRGRIIRTLMCKESSLILYYINGMSTAFLNLVQAYGYDNIVKSAVSFYRAIRPDNDIVMGYYDKVTSFFDSFFPLFIEFLSSVIKTEDDLRETVLALRTLFIDPEIRYPMTPKIYSTEDSDEVRKHYETKFKRCIQDFHRAATIIQKYYRRKILENLQANHIPGSKIFRKYSEKLRKLGDSVFSLNKRDQQAGKLLRLILISNKELKDAFRFSVEDVIERTDFSGHLNVNTNSWVPLIRLSLQIHSEEPMPCAFYLSCNLPNTIVTIVDNDSIEHFQLLTQNLPTCFFKTNIKGYTLFSYGWSEDITEVYWRLEIVKVKHFPGLHSCITCENGICTISPPLKLKLLEVSDMYLPNRVNRICKCKVITNKECTLSIRLSLPLARVKFELRVTSQSFEGEFEVLENILCLKGTGGLIIPSKILPEGCYFIEAEVLYDSWPLTIAEWGFVELKRTNVEKFIKVPQHSVDDSSRKRSRKSNDSGRGSEQSAHFIWTKPMWKIEVLSEEEDGVILNKEELFLKTSKAKDAKAGCDIRKKFLFRCFQEEMGAGEHVFGELDWELFEPNIDLYNQLIAFTRNPSPVRYSKSPRTLPDRLNRLLHQFSVEDRSIVIRSRSSELRYLTLLDMAAFNYAGRLDDMTEIRKLALDRAQTRRYCSEKKISENYEEAFKLRCNALETRNKAVAREDEKTERKKEETKAEKKKKKK